MKMFPYIVKLDETKPLGKIMSEYGKQKYISGFYTGFFSGVILITFLATIKHKYTK
jgi:hypothetical protein